jgi:hypothetical protein
MSNNFDHDWRVCECDACCDDRWEYRLAISE